MPAEERRREEGRSASFALRAGVWTSGALMAGGLVLAALCPAAFLAGAPDWSLALRAGLRGNGEAVALLGIALLVATPYLRVALLAVVYARRGQWRMLAVSLAVLALLASGVALGRRH